jgi:hypothetical protein
MNLFIQHITPFTVVTNICKRNGRCIKRCMKRQKAVRREMKQAVEIFGICIFTKNIFGWMTSLMAAY